MTFLLWFVLLGFQGQPVPPKAAAKPAPPPPSRIEQLLKRLGIDPQIYSKLGGVRNVSGRSTGTLLLSFDLSTGREEVLAEGQPVWSPLRVSDDRVLFVRPDGVYAVSLKPVSQPSRVNAWVPDVLLGRMAGEGLRVMGALRSGTGAACQLKVAAIGLDQSPSTSPVEDSTVSCADDVLRNTLRLWGRRFVRAAPAGGGQLQVTEVKEGQSIGDVYFQNLEIRVPAEGVVSRSDPVWVNERVIVYVGSR